MIRLALPALIVLLGVVLLVQTAVGGGGVGYVIGAAFVGAGAARAWLQLRQ